jgi:hypothetical protein
MTLGVAHLHRLKCGSVLDMAPLEGFVPVCVGRNCQQRAETKNQFLIVNSPIGEEIPPRRWPKRVT